MGLGVGVGVGVCVRKMSRMPSPTLAPSSPVSTTTSALILVSAPVKAAPASASGVVIHLVSKLSDADDGVNALAHSLAIIAELVNPKMAEKSVVTTTLNVLAPSTLR